MAIDIIDYGIYVEFTEYSSIILINDETDKHLIRTKYYNFKLIQNMYLLFFHI